MSLIENSLEKLRRAASGTKPAAVREPIGALRESTAAAEPHYVHRRISLDMARLRAEGYLPDVGQERPFADWCHRIKRPLIDRALAASGTDDSKLILLTSALPGDGKTFITLNLALSMARERDISVLVVDGDLPRAQISRLLRIHGDTGLLNALRDDTLDVESLVQDTDVPGLEVLSAGGPQEDAAELVASARMREIATRLSARDPRRLILFDSPPLLVSMEARALISLPGQIVLVARVGRTPQHAVAEAVAQIKKEKLQGLVLNDSHVVNEHGYYYDYSSHGEPAE